jgi:single-strand DNA-binding protein
MLEYHTKGKIMNSVQLIGNMVRDADLKYTQSGVAIGSFGIAVNKKVKNQQGSYDDKAMFFDVTAFGKTAENINAYFRKGSKIGITGELNFEQWQGQDGSKHSKVSVICNQFDFIDKKEGGQNNGYSSQQQPRQQNHGDYQQHKQQQPQRMPDQLPEIDIDESSIPF